MVHLGDKRIQMKGHSFQYKISIQNFSIKFSVQEENVVIHKLLLI